MNLELDKRDLCFVIYMFLSNNPSSGDINSSNLPCYFRKEAAKFEMILLQIIDSTLWVITVFDMIF